MTYELWDSDSGNAIAGFASEAEALAVVRAEIQAAGDEAVSEWFLRKVDRRGRSRVVAEGDDLARFALGMSAPRATAERP